MKKQIKTYLTKLAGARLNLMYKINPGKAVKKSFELFSTPRKGKLGPNSGSFLNEAGLEKIEINGIPIQTYWWPNEKETILLLHGWQSNTKRWKNLIEHLRKEGYSVLSLDAPAHGLSGGKQFLVPTYAKATTQLIEKYQPQFAIGHSVGAATLIYHQHKQEKPSFKKLVLLAPPSKMVYVMHDFQHQLGLNQDLMDQLETVFKEETGYDFSEFSLHDFSKNLNAKVLMIHDKDDKIVKWDETRTLAQNWKNARLLITQGLGHGLKSDAIHQNIINFLKAN